MAPPNIIVPDAAAAGGQASEGGSKAPDSPTSLKNHHHPHRVFKVYVTGFGVRGLSVSDYFCYFLN